MLETFHSYIGHTITNLCQRLTYHLSYHKTVHILFNALQNHKSSYISWLFLANAKILDCTNHKIKPGSQHDVMAKVLNCSLKVREFKLLSQ